MNFIKKEFVQCATLKDKIKTNQNNRIHFNGKWVLKLHIPQSCRQQCCADKLLRLLLLLCCHSLTCGSAHVPLLGPLLLQVGAGAQAGPSAAGCPVGCLPSCRHAADVRSRGGEREEWLQADGVRKRTAEANDCQVCSTDNPAVNTPAAARRINGRRSRFSACLMGQRKRKKNAR